MSDEKSAQIIPIPAREEHFKVGPAQVDIWYDKEDKLFHWKVSRIINRIIAVDGTAADITAARQEAREHAKVLSSSKKR